MQEIRSAEVRAQLSRIMDDVFRGDQVTVTRFGRPLVVIVSPEWHQEAMAALEAMKGARPDEPPETRGDPA